MGNACAMLSCISIHAPHAGSDLQAINGAAYRHISIHDPHAGSDHGGHLPLKADRDFNPRSPRGERRAGRQKKSGKNAFQSTLPTRGATSVHTNDFVFRYISIHAPHAGSDLIPITYPTTIGDFNPRSPRGERPRF